MVDFGPESRRERLQRRVVEAVADVFEPRLTPSERARLRER